MVQTNGVKYACETCIRGHRVSTCSHADRPLIMIRPKGRPVSQCSHCREARKSRTAHHTCHCGLQQQALPSFIKDTTVDPLGEHPPRQCFCAYDGNCLCANRSSKSIVKPRKLSRTSSTTSSRASRDKSKPITLNVQSVPVESGSSSTSSVSSPLQQQEQQQQHQPLSRHESTIAMPRSTPQTDHGQTDSLYPPPIDVSSDLYTDLFGEFSNVDCCGGGGVDHTMFLPSELDHHTDAADTNRTQRDAVLDSRLLDLVILDQTTAELDRLSRSPPFAIDHLTLSDFELHQVQ